MRIQFASGGSGLCILHRPSSTNRLSRQLHHLCCRPSPAMGASPRSVWHLFSVVSLADGIFCRDAYWVLPRWAGRRFRWSSWAGRCWPIDSIISRRSWRHSGSTWRLRPLSWELGRWEHLGPTITTLVQVTSLPQWPTTWKSLACAAGRLQTVCHVEWRLVIKLRSAWKCRLWTRVTVPLRWMILIGVIPKFSVFASGMLRNSIWWFWIVVTGLLRAKWTTRWSSVDCLRWRSICWHSLSNKDSGKLLSMRDEI